MNLGFYYRGHGVSVADRDRMEHGDYKKICYIRESGLICWEGSPETLNTDTLREINMQAEKIRASFMEKWDHLSEFKKFTRIIDCLTVSELSTINKDTPMRDVIERYFDKYIKRI